MLKQVFVSLLVLHSCFCIAQLRKDSLLNSIYLKSTVDTSKVNSYCLLVPTYLNDGMPDSALECANNALALSQKISFKKGEGTAYANFGRYYYETADYKTSIVNYEKAIKIFNEVGLKLKEAKALIGIASTWSQLGDVHKALNYNIRALTILELIKNDTEIAKAYSNIGNLYEKLEDRPQAIKYFKKCISLSDKTHNLKQKGTALYNLSRSLTELKQLKNADSCLQEAYLIFKNLNYKAGLSYVVQNFAVLATQAKDFKKAEKYYREGIVIAQETDDKNILAYSYSGLADVLMNENKHSEALNYLNIAMPIAIEIDNLELEINLYNKYSEAYYELGEYKKSTDNHILFSTLKDSLFKASSSKQIAEMQTKYDSEKKEKENQLLTTQNSLSSETITRQKITGYFIIAGLLLTIGLLFFFFKGLQNQKKATKIIEAQQLETEHQKHLIEEKQKEILDSIHYAKRIQQAMLTSENYIKRYFENIFILFKPKDIVSGDFYWAYHENEKTFLITADCTGHGVPGAMMSMLSINILNEIICERKIVESNKILNLMRKEIIKALNSEDSTEEAKDGLDCSLLIFDHSNNTLQYTCANNGFYIIRNNEIITIGADKMPVGKSPREHESFTTKEITLQKNDFVITLTDGYADQFGGPKGKKFKYKPFEELILANVNSPLTETKNNLNLTIENWRGNLEQVDDICIIGIKI